MKYKAVISDLDGTLLNNNHRISGYTKKTIKKLMNEGIHFFIATGRHHEDIQHIKRSLQLDTTFITSNGCGVYNSNKEKILGYNLDENITKTLIDLDVDDDIHKNLYQEDKWYVERENEWLYQFNKESDFFYDIIDFNTLNTYKATKFFFLSENHDKLVKLQDRIKEIFPKELNISFSLVNSLEIMPKGISKGYAIKKVLKQYNILPEEAIAFGDGLNDLEMLRTVGEGFIMDNAHDKLKEALPDYEIITNNEDNGVAKKLEEIFQI